MTRSLFLQMSNSVDQTLAARAIPSLRSITQMQRLLRSYAVGLIVAIFSLSSASKGETSYDEPWLTARLE
jgi:hypothetical protein